jgi:hypothetical protein
MLSNSIKPADLLLWVGAICINQEDLDEKTVQVPLMGEVYSSAELVVIWLGEVSEAMKKNFGKVKKLFWFARIPGFGQLGHFLAIQLGLEARQDALIHAGKPSGPAFT